MNIINSKLLINMLIKHELIMPFYRMLPLCLHTCVCEPITRTLTHSHTRTQKNVFNLGCYFASLILGAEQNK